jgi:hypothetical protein
MNIRPVTTDDAENCCRNYLPGIRRNRRPAQFPRHLASVESAMQIAQISVGDPKNVIGFVAETDDGQFLLFMAAR